MLYFFLRYPITRGTWTRKRFSRQKLVILWIRDRTPVLQLLPLIALIKSNTAPPKHLKGNPDLSQQGQYQGYQAVIVFFFWQSKIFPINRARKRETFCLLAIAISETAGKKAPAWYFAQLKQRQKLNPNQTLSKEGMCLSSVSRTG